MQDAFVRSHFTTLSPLTAVGPHAACSSTLYGQTTLSGLPLAGMDWLQVGPLWQRDALPSLLQTPPNSQ